MGYVRDLNWFAQRPGSPYGVGCYEYAVNANGESPLIAQGAGATDIYGRFQISNLPAGNYTVISWDVWWRSSIAFSVPVPASGNSPTVDLRLHATMWGYPAFWDDTGYHEFGQTFVASGPISMIYLRCPWFEGAPTYTLTVHENGPNGPQIGVARSFGTGDQRVVYSYGEMPTIPGKIYYLRVRTSGSAKPGVIMQMDPRPDGSDPMPGGCLWLGSPGNVRPLPDRDLGVVIMCDDDGMLTDMFVRPSGSAITEAASIGQTFVARGVNLIAAGFWLADPSAPLYEAKVRADGPGGTIVSTIKRGRPARLTADPEMLVAWPPGECPLVPGNKYYIEVTRVGGGVFRQILVNRSDPFAHGNAWVNTSPLEGVDLAGTLLEETSPSAAVLRTVKFVEEPEISESDRHPHALTIRWRTAEPADSQVEYAAYYPPYTDHVYDTNLVMEHVIVLTNLLPHTPYHWRVRSAAPGYRPAFSRDNVVCTKADQENLLRNPGFEEGSGPSPRSSIPGWSKVGGLDMRTSDGSWFWGLPPRTGTWLFEGAANASESQGYLFQRVRIIPGKDYTFSAWITTWMRENDTWKYDVWNDRNRLIHMRLGIDPTGGTNPAAASVQWTPRVYSHLRYSNLALTTTASADYITVFIAMEGRGGQWHLYGVDDCVLTETPPVPPRITNLHLDETGAFSFAVITVPGKTVDIEVSSQLEQWDVHSTIVNVTGQTTFHDSVMPATSHRFFRAVLK